MKIGIITQARLSSTRLPKKILMEINSKPLLQFHIERAQRSGYPLIVATSTDPEDADLITFCKNNHVPSFQGNLCDVLSRYYHAAKQYKMDTIIRITSDCPLIDPQIIQMAVKLYLKTNANYVSNTLNRTYPRGFDVEVFSFQLLQKAYEETTSNEDREHVTPYMWHNTQKLFKIEQLIQSIDKSQYRITVDVLKDFELIKVLIKQYKADTLNYLQITNILKEHPEIVCINQHVQHKKDGQYE